MKFVAARSVASSFLVAMPGSAMTVPQRMDNLPLTAGSSFQ